MAITISSREFNHDAAAVKRAAQQSPVFVTNRGELEVVIISAAEYRRLTAAQPNIVSLLSNKAAAEIEFTVARNQEPQREVLL